MGRATSSIVVADGIAVVCPQAVERGQKVDLFLLPLAVMKKLWALVDLPLLRMADVEESLLEHVKGHPGHYVVCSIETVQTVCPHYSSLLSEEYFLTFVETVELKWLDDLLDFLDQKLCVLELFSFALLVEVEELISDIV